MTARKPSHGTQSLAHAAWQRGNLHSYARLLKNSADSGDASALAELGMHHRDGLEDSAGATILPKSRAGALRCFRRAAELGNTDAMTSLAVMLTQDARRARGAKQKALRSEVLTLERRATSLGDPIAAFNLAVSHQLAGQHVEAVRRFRHLAARGDIEALLEVARAELHGVGMRRNVSAALRKLERVALAKGDVDQLNRERAMLTLALTHWDGWLVPRNFDTALRWLRSASKLGSAAARGMLEDVDES